MSESTTAPAEQQTEPSLEDVYKEVGITEPSARPQAAPVQYQQQPQAPQAPAIPDPYDVEAYKSFMANMVHNQTALNASLQEFRGNQAQMAQKAAMQQLEEDISKATEFVSKEAGIDNKDLAHFELDNRARTDPRFKTLWENRSASSAHKAAFDKALKVISKEISKKYEVRADPTLVANRRALKASQNSSATTDKDDSADDSWGQLQGVDFQRKWEAMVRQNN